MILMAYSGVHNVQIVHANITVHLLKLNNKTWFFIDATEVNIPFVFFPLWIHIILPCVAEINTDSADSIRVCRHKHRRAPVVISHTSSIEKPFISIKKHLMITRTKEGGETKEFSLVLQTSIYFILWKPDGKKENSSGFCYVYIQCVCVCACMILRGRRRESVGEIVDPCLWLESH